MKQRLVRWFFSWIAGWLDMICGLLSVITFALWRPWWDLSFRIWRGRLLLKNKIELESQVEVKFLLKKRITEIIRRAWK